MGYKRRQLATRSDRGRVSRSVLDRYAVKKPVTFPTILFERRLTELKRIAAETLKAELKREKETAA